MLSDWLKRKRLEKDLWLVFHTWETYSIPPVGLAAGVLNRTPNELVFRFKTLAFLMRGKEEEQRGGEGGEGPLLKLLCNGRDLLREKQFSGSPAN